jgi:uncharacterized damage-inducible protein DinB
MYRTIADFTEDWNYERGMTRKLLDNVTDESLGQAVRPGGRTLGRLAWHLVLTLVEMPGEAKITVEGPHIGHPPPVSAAALASQYSEIAHRLGEAVAAQWAGVSLVEEVPMYGEKWKRGFVLGALVKHEVHHRGQMTVLMRQAGLAVPGIYGPAEEEWAAMGMPAQE